MALGAVATGAVTLRAVALGAVARLSRRAWYPIAQVEALLDSRATAPRATASRATAPRLLHRIRYPVAPAVRQLSVTDQLMREATALHL